MIALAPQHLEEVRQILAKHVPRYAVWAFGSRVNGNVKPHSDLDLVIVTETPLELRCTGNLREAFEDSNLPMRVDFIDWATISEEFREVIRGKYDVIQLPD